MSTRVLDRVETWRTRRLDAGYRDLQRLAANEFSGVVRAGDAELFMTSGVAITLRGDDIEAFETTAGTAYSAPSPALPLLAVMQEQNNEVRDQFYTEQTSLSTVDETLSQGGFTGYVELSEDVLSGDYYLVYHAGTSRAVGFVGESGRLLDGHEAFETATDEVGIYEVRPVTFDPVDLPEPASEPEPEPTGPDDAETAIEQSTDSVGDDAEMDDSRQSNTVAGGTETEQSESERADTPDATPPADATDAELRTVPSVVPDRTTGRTDGQSATDRTAQPGRPGSDPGDSSSAEENESTATPEPVESGDEPDDRAEPTGEGLDQQDGDEPDEQLATLREERDELNEQLASVREERDRLAKRLDAVRDERDALRRQLDTLGEVDDRPGPEGDPHPEATGPTRDLTHSEAVEETAVFVRYESRGGVTLSDVHSGDSNRGSFRENLQLEVYGGFDGSVNVEGEPYEAFVESSLPYEFVEWVLTTLPFEIRETGNRASLSGLYDALPSIDHADLDASVGTADSTESFEVVFRDQRGQPLLVAAIDDDREPVGETQMEQLVTAARQARTATDSLAGAFLVTRGYFDGGALDIVDEATQGRLLSRNKKKSFVNISRNRGYHLCLVEAREGSPRLTVPDI
jgi:hypothetical protein